MMRWLLAALVLILCGRAHAETFIYVADHETGKVIKIKSDGTLVWDAPNGNGHDVQVLANKNILINHGGVVEEIAPDKKIVWSVRSPVVASAESVQRLANGNTVIADNGRMKVIEIDKDQKLIWEFAVPNDNQRKTPTMRQVRRLGNGNTLICASTEDKVIEVSPEKKIVWSYAVPFPYLATRLANGNTLISSGDGYGSPRGFFVVEVDSKGKEVWKYGGADAPEDQKLKWPSGHVRLPNGNTLIAEARGGVIREVSPDKKTVRIIRSPAMKHPATIAVMEDADDKPAARPIRVLFVGNSQVYYNDLPAIVEALSESAPADRPRIKADRALAGGASLESHWNRGTGKGTARAKIAEEKYDFVILQEIFNGKPESFNKHGKLFHDLIRQNGAKTVLFSTASINSMYPKGFQDLHAMNVALGKELNVTVVPAGNAWLDYWGKSPTEEQRLALYDGDKAHPGKKGSYIYACTLYAVLTGQSPVGLTHRIPKQPEDAVTPAEAKKFQESAWRVHQEINGKATVPAKP